MASSKIRRPRDMRKLCIMNPSCNGLDFDQLRAFCRPFGQMLHFQWYSGQNSGANTFAFVLYNTEEYV